jgi:hypothetical protein
MKRFKGIIYGFSLSCSLVFAERFEVNIGVVYDNKTQLYWQQMPSNLQFDWQTAQNYCINLDDGGYSDWRLPNFYELRSLIDYSKSEDDSITSEIIIIKIANYWSSSKVISSSFRMWGVNFYSRRGEEEDPSYKLYAVCVRG